MVSHYHIGSLIKRLRKQRGLGQEELAYPIIDRATLSKIESGKVMPNKKTLEAIFERLGFNPHNICDFFHDDETAAIRKKMDKLEGSLVNGEVMGNMDELVRKADDLLKELEGNEKFMANELNVQYVLTYRVTVDYYGKRINIERATELLNEALHISIPEFCEQNLEDYHITRQELRILNLLGEMYYNSGQQEKATSFMYRLKNNMENHCIDNDALGQNYPTIIYNLVICLTTTGQYEEAIKICDRGIEACKETGFLFNLPLIIWEKALCYHKLGAKDECERLVRQVFHVSDMYGQYGRREEARKFAKEELGVEF